MDSPCNARELHRRLNQAKDLTEKRHTFSTNIKDFVILKRFVVN